MRKTWILRLLLPLSLAGCSPQPTVPAAPPIVEAQAGPDRLKAALGQDSYNSAGVAWATLGNAEERLLAHEKYARLDELLSSLEASPPDWGDEVSPGQNLLGPLVIKTEDQERRLEYYLDRWRAASTSKYSRMAKATMMSRWLIGHCHWQTFDEAQDGAARIQEALSALQTAAEVPALLKDAEYWETRLRLGVVVSEVPKAMDQWLEQALKCDPQRWSACAVRALRDSPYWGGASVAGYLQTVDRLSQRYGPEVYAVCAWNYFSIDAFNAARFRAIGFDPVKIQKGYDALRSRHPSSRLLLSKEARLLAATEDTEQARALFTELGQNWDSTAWGGDGDSYDRDCSLLEITPQASGTGAPTIKAGPESKLCDDIGPLALTKLAGETHLLFVEKRYWVLEELASQLSAGDDARLRTFYNACYEQNGQGARKRALDRLGGWDAAIPHSPTAKVVRALVLMTGAWEARGGGWGYQVSTQGADTFKRELTQAAGLLDSSELPDPFACQLRITIAMGLGEPISVVDKAMARSAKLNPKSTLALSAKLIYLLPRWQGSRKKLSEAAEQAMRERGDSVLAEALRFGDYRDAFGEDLPAQLLERSYIAADKASPPLAGVATQRFYHAKTHKNPKKMIAGLEQINAEQDYWDWPGNDLESWAKTLAGPLPFRFFPTVKLVESGQYAATIPRPTRLAAPSLLPIIAGRSLGLRIRHLDDVPIFWNEVVTLERPEVARAANEPPLATWRSRTIAPGAVKAGDEELVLWTIEEGEQPVGEWKLSVSCGDRVLAEKTFLMGPSEAPAEPGMTLTFRGLYAPTPLLGNARSAIRSTDQVPMRLGVDFGALIRYSGKPTLASCDFVMPPRHPGEKGERQTIPLDCSGVARNVPPDSQLTWLFEKPEELVPGVWKMSFTVDGRPIGDIPFIVK